MSRAVRQPPIGDYALIGDCHTAALVSRAGSIDWCCMPRFDSGSCFGRLLDWECGGHCTIGLGGADAETTREYIEGTLVLRTTVRAAGGEAVMLDCFAMRAGGSRSPRRQILRVMEGVRGSLDVRIDVAPRFDYGSVRPWLRRHSRSTHSATGGDDALVAWSDLELEDDGEHGLAAVATLRAGERLRLSLVYVRPEMLDAEQPEQLDGATIDRRLEQTLAWWRRWSRGMRHEGADAPAMMRSAITLKALSHAPTGALVAAPTAALPETPRGQRNWDYRYSWLRDSTFSVRALAGLGYGEEAGGFRRFVMRSSAGHAEELQIVYGVGGERRMPELELDWLHGYRGARPVRIGNGAAGQLQLDSFGELLNLTWHWHERGHSPDDDDWSFLAELVERAVESWRKPDRGIWEWRGRPRHFVYSKAGCWSALDRGIALAGECMRKAPVRRWSRARKEIREAIERRGYDRRRGVFVQAFGHRAMDASLLLLPVTGFVAWDDERMVRTADAIREELGDRGQIRRYAEDDGLPGREGAFLACSFWLAECYARQGRLADAREAFDGAASSANDVGLYSEELDTRRGEMLGNFPQALSHLSHITAALALDESTAAVSEIERDRVATAASG